MLIAMDLIILLVGVLQKPLSLRILLALVARLGIYLGNGVALYALVAAILHNGRPMHHTADEEFLSGVVNALLQPPRYAPGHQLLNNPRNRSLRLSPDTLTPTELTVLRAILQVQQPRDHTSGRPGREATSTTPTTTTATTVSFTTAATSTAPTTTTATTVSFTTTVTSTT